MRQLTMETSVGRLTVSATENAISRVEWGGNARGTSELLEEAERQLNAYFAGERRSFDLPLHVSGNAMQQAVCDAMRAIPFGETKTYGDIAAMLNAPAQAIGQACGKNPIPVIIPCHRVLGANSLGGFSGGTGIETKVALLKHEGAASLLI